MKKIFTLIAASLLTMATFAADRKPSVTVQTSKKYEIVIDGRSYFSNNAATISLADLRSGNHTVIVYDAGRGFFQKNKRVISSSTFILRGNDINICVDQFGRVQMNESRMMQSKDAQNWNKKGKDKGFQKDDHGRTDYKKHF